MKTKKILKHSIMMLKKNKRLYVNLVVVLTLSFAFSLGMMLYFDGKIFNDNKEIISKPEELITISNPNEKQMLSIKKEIDKNSAAVSYDYYMQGIRKNEIDFEIYAIPSNLKHLYLDDTSYVNINGKDDIFNLGDDEIYVYREFFDIYKDLKYIELPIKLKKGKQVIKRYKIKGYFDLEGRDSDYDTNEIVYDKESGEYQGRTSVIIKKSEDIDFYIENTATIIYTKSQERIMNLLNMYNIEYNAPILWKNSINEEIKNTRIMECILIVILYVLLGINIQSIAANTLEKRKYEIGVQRTIGAKKRDIIFQFIIESGIVTGLSLIISSYINLIISCGYKLWNYYFHNREVTIYMSDSSIVVFLIMCISMVIFTNYIFAKEVLNVEVIKYLKEG